MALGECAAADDEALAAPGTAQTQADDSNITALALEMMIQHGFAGAIYLAGGYAALHACEGDPVAEFWWMRVLVSIVSLRDLPSAWHRQPAGLH